MVLGHPCRIAFPPPQMMMMTFICSCRNNNHRSRPGYQRNQQPTTVSVEERGGRGTTSRRTTTRVAPDLSPPKPVFAGHRSSVPAPRAPSPWNSVLGVIDDHISQCPFLQITYTAENLHADDNTSPGGRPRFHPPSRRHPHAPSTTPTTTGLREDRCPVISKLPLHCHTAAKMSQHIHIGLKPVLAVHGPSQPAAGSHCPAREDSAPHCGTEFGLSREQMVSEQP